MNWWHEAKYDRKPHPQAVRRQHSMKSIRGLSKPVCAHCGLVGLNNDATRFFLRKGCWKYPDED